MNQIYMTYGIPVYFSPYHTGAAEARGFFWNRHILVGPHFMRDSVKVQQAVLLHEVKHCKAWHFEKRIACLFAVAAPAFFLPLQILAVLFAMGVLWFGATAYARHNELDADRFVVENGHGEFLLEWLKRQMPRESDFYPSFEQRCAAISEAMKESKDAQAVA